MTDTYTGLSVPYNPNLTSADYSRTHYTYDEYGNKMAVTDALGNTEFYTYDENGYITFKTLRAGDIIIYGYYASGLEQSQYTYYPVFNISTNSTYDRHGRKKVFMQHKERQINTYLNGNLISVTEPNNVVKTYTYDEYGNKLSYTLTINSEIIDTVTYEYDIAFRLTGVTENGKITTYTYDENGNRSSMYTEGSNAATTYTYNDANQVTSLCNYFLIDGTPFLASMYSYSYNTDANQRAKADQLSQIFTVYQYDGNGQLAAENEKRADITNTYIYTYDAAYNRSSLSVTGEEEYITVYAYDKNDRLISEIKKVGGVDTQTDYTYDNNGNLITAATGGSIKTYTYDVKDKLREYHDGTTLTEYTYGPDGLRKSKIENGVTIKFVWDGANMVYEYDLASPADGTAYLYGMSLISQRDSAGDYSYYLFNAHGDVVQLANENNQVVKWYYYDAFGNETDPDPIDGNPFRYCGEYYDAETGTYYLRARYYNPRTGRFTQEDPIGAGLNWYTYCLNNPIMYIDPWGLESVMVEDIVRKNKGQYLVVYIPTSLEEGAEELPWVAIILDGKEVLIPYAYFEVINNKVIADSSLFTEHFNITDEKRITHREVDPFYSEIDAVLAFSLKYHKRSLEERQEYAARIDYRGGWYFFDGVTSSAMSAGKNLEDLSNDERNTVSISINSNTVANIHTHWNPNGHLDFSDYDYMGNENNNIYLVNREGDVLYAIPNGSNKDDKDGYTKSEKVFNIQF